MRHGSLFSGIGGFDLAAQWMGWENVFHCEWNEFGQKILKHYWPNAISYHDITKSTFTIHRGTIDILTGGFPCQPFSTAGKREGTDDDRYLWPEMLRVIREVQPRYIVGENVRGLVNWSGGMVFDTVCADLEAEGYEVLPILLPAASVNAPHKRDRIFFIAHFNHKYATDSDSIGCSRNSEKEGPIKSDTNRWMDKNIGHDRNQIWSKINGCGSNATNTQSTGFQARIERQKEKQFRRTNECFGAEKWHRFPTVSPVHFGDDGLSDRLDGITFSKWRKESIKGAGNAIVPQVAFQIFKTIEQYERLFS